MLNLNITSKTKNNSKYSTYYWVLKSNLDKSKVMQVNTPLPPLNHQGVPHIGDIVLGFFHVQGIPPLYTIFRELHFRRARQTKNRSKKTTAQGLDKYIKIYEAKRCMVSNLYIDSVFQCVQNTAISCNLNINATHEYVGKVEQSTRISHAVLCYIVHLIPFNRLPRLMVSSFSVNI